MQSMQDSTPSARGGVVSSQDPPSVSTPAVSVIIPAYNSAEYVTQALDSVLAQTLADCEVIVVNDGSPDTEQLDRVLEPYMGRIVYLRLDNRGPGGARNAAIQRARGEFVALLDSDDFWYPDFLAEQVERLKSDPLIDLVYSDAMLIGDSPHAGRTIMQRSPSRGVVNFESLLTGDCEVTTSTVVVRRRAMVESGLFDDSLRRCEDFELWLRMAHNGSAMGYQTKVLAAHRLRSESLSSDRIRMIESVLRVFKKVGTWQIPDSSRKLLQRNMQDFEARIELERARRNLVDRNYPEAARGLARANDFYRSVKIKIAITLLRVAPSLLREIYLLRDRVFDTYMKLRYKPQGRMPRT
jgi:glycosyltransferase involved in cell wall biosynthesis